MSCTGGTSDGTATAGRPSARNGRPTSIDLIRPQSFPRSLASRTQQTVLALLSAGSLFFLAARGGGTAAPPAPTPPHPPALPAPPREPWAPPETPPMPHTPPPGAPTPRG